MSFSFLYQIPIGEVIDDLVLTYMPEGGTVYDPTAGEKQRQLKQLRKGKLDIQYEIVTSDLKPTGQFIASFFKLPLRSNSMDLTIYDPPFRPAGQDQDKRYSEIMEVRCKDYGINFAAGVTLEDVKRFYSKKALKELMRVTRKYLFIRGSDFYWPPTTYNIYYFWDTCIANVKALGYEVTAIHVNRVNHGRLAIYRARMRKYERPIINHSYIAVIKKEAAA